MTNFHTCLVCSNPSQTDIDGNGLNDSKKMKGCNVVQSQLRSVFVLQKLLEVSISSCVDLLRNSDGANPSDWFSCCWNCFEIIEQSEKIYNELIHLEKQWKNLKIAIQKQLQTSRERKLQQPTSTFGEKENETIVNTIRNEAFKRNALSYGFINSEVHEEEQLNNIKVEVNFDNVDTELVDPLSDNSNNEDATFGIPVTVLKRKKPGILRNSGVGNLNQSRSGRLIKPKKSKFEPPSVYSSAEQHDGLDNYILGFESESDIQEDWCTENKPKKTESYFSPKTLNGNGQTRTPDLILSQNIICKEEISETILSNDSIKPTRSSRTTADRNKEVHDDNYVVKTQKMLKCKYCPEEYLNSKLRYAHAISIHECYYKFNCNHCNKKHSSSEYLNFHLRRFHKGKVNPDPACTLVLEKPPPRGRSKKKEIESFVCMECNYDFKTKQRLSEHQATFHRKERNFICEICSMSFTSNSNLKSHQNFKHGGSEEKKSLECKECGKILATPPSLRSHIKIMHKKELPFRCSICNIGKLFQSALDRQILQTHTDGPKPHACTICPKSYASKSALETHKRTHTGERPFKCSFCDKSFYDKRKLARHEKNIHVSKEKLFQCEECGSRFVSKYNLNAHVNSTHKKKQSSEITQLKKIMDKQELMQYVESANKAMLEKPITTKGKKNRVSIFRLHMEQQLKQKDLFINTTTENETENQN